MLAKKAQKHMTMAMVKGVPSKNKPMAIEQIEPQAIWMDPIMAEADPAPLLNGLRARLATLGKLKP